jgi:hypothetical protein
MATIRRRKSAWQVQIRRLGHQVSRTFRLRARQTEAELDRGRLPADSRRLRTHTLADLLTRYEAEIVPRKRSADREVYMLRVRHSVARVHAPQARGGRSEAKHFLFSQKGNK